MNQFTMHEPRDLTRAAYQAAMLTAPSDQARQRYAQSLQWYEMKWQAQDAQARKAAQVPPAEPAQAEEE